MPRLVISRKKGEFIKIGEDIFVSVDRTGKANCRLVIAAPEDIPVLRGELIGQKKEGKNGGES